MEYMFKPLRHYADFKGRARRKEFWSYWLFLVIAALVAMYLDSALGLGGTMTTYNDGNSVGFNMTGGTLSLILLVATLIPNLAVGVRRLHDVGKSGWHILIGLIPIFGWIYLLYQYVQPGMTGPNEFGADPKAADSSKVFT